MRSVIAQVAPHARGQALTVQTGGHVSPDSQVLNARWLRQSFEQDGGDAADRWIVDSGSTDHLVCHREWLGNYHELEEPINIFCANDQPLQAVGIGEVSLRSKKGGTVLMFPRVLYIPGFGKNLFSYYRADKSGASIAGSNGELRLTFREALSEPLCAYEHRRQYCIKGAIKLHDVNVVHGRLPRAYTVQYLEELVHANELAIAEALHVQHKRNQSLELWHARLGHANERAVRETIA